MKWNIFMTGETDKNLKLVEMTPTSHEIEAIDDNSCRVKLDDQYCVVDMSKEKLIELLESEGK